MGCGLACFFVVFINVLFFLVGLVLTIVGGLFSFNTAFFYSIMKWIYAQLDQMNQEQAHQAVDIFLGLLKPISLGVFIFGLILLVICMLGIVGAWCDSRCAIILYIILEGIVLVAEIVVLIIFEVKRDIITNPAKDALRTAVSNYISYDSTDPNSVFLAVFMPVLQCCGVDSGNDFNNSTKFRRTYNYNGATIPIAYPVPCCHNPPETGSNCPAVFTPDNSYINTGCWKKLENALVKESKIVMYVWIGIIVLQGLLLIAGLVLACRNKGKMV
ncbi:unnamed protein product [Calicophoron daubneyi]|uniref:Tetraspanin n=1 Tax=Calicophoron daubneyi TaxID=300641 RepID=A0AAV2T019_CALDB